MARGKHDRMYPSAWPNCSLIIGHGPFWTWYQKWYELGWHIQCLIQKGIAVWTAWRLKEDHILIWILYALSQLVHLKHQWWSPTSAWHLPSVPYQSGKEIQSTRWKMSHNLFFILNGKDVTQHQQENVTFILSFSNWAIMGGNRMAVKLEMRCQSPEIIGKKNQVTISVGQRKW